MKSILVTGSSGLIGSEVCEYFHSNGWAVHGIDNNQRAVFFGTGATDQNQDLGRGWHQSGQVTHAVFAESNMCGVVEIKVVHVNFWR